MINSIDITFLCIQISVEMPCAQRMDELNNNSNLMWEVQHTKYALRSCEQLGPGFYSL